MSATGSPALEPIPLNFDELDELALLCIICDGRVSPREKVIYWPSAADRISCIAHVRCVDKAVSL